MWLIFPSRAFSQSSEADLISSHSSVACASSSALTTGWCPPTMAFSSGVFPKASFRLTADLCLRRSSTTASCPAPAATWRQERRS